MKMRMDINMKRKNNFIILLLISVMIMLCGCGVSQKEDSGSESQEESSIDLFAMDTYMTLKAYGENRDQALEAAQTEIERLDALWSVGEEDSEITKLNTSKKEQVSDETLELIHYAQTIADRTDRAFDITIYPFMVLWGFTTQDYKVPSEAEISRILDSQIGMDKISIDEKTNTVSLKDNAEIDLGGIAKGYTSQKVAEIFANYGVEHGVISLGGNVQAIGTKVDGSRWKVGIESPSDEIENMVGTYGAKDEAVITSGGYERYFEQDGVTYHHILDPKTGRPSDSDLISVTIVSKDGMRADCLSTTLFVLGKEKAEQYWKEHSDEFDCILVDKDCNIYVTEGIEENFTSDHEYEVVRK
jgi:thiamine biosynthesis lipoprotein